MLTEHRVIFINYRLIVLLWETEFIMRKDLIQTKLLLN